MSAELEKCSHDLYIFGILFRYGITVPNFIFVECVADSMEW